MAVFTEVSEDEARALLRALNLGELRDAARHPERHREHQLLRHHAGRAGPARVRADAVRAADLRAAAVLPAPDEAPGAARHPGARPGGGPQRRHPAHGVRQAGRGGEQAARASSELAPGAGALRRRSARCWRACTWPARDYPAPPAQPARPGLVERDRAGGAALRRRRSRPRCCAANWPSRTTWPPAPPRPRCRAGRCMPTCSATT